MSHLNRRDFFKSTLAAAATITIAGTKSSGRVIGANDTVRIGIAGLNGRGGAHVKEFSKLPGVEIVTLIDPDTRTYAKRLAEVKKQCGKEPTTVQDVRKALEDKNLDAISIATPNHWHALMTIWACQAGKDVYVEKPCSHEVAEGRLAVEAARKHNCIVQHGTQGRSSSSWAKLAALAKAGTLGKLLVSRGLCYKNRPTIGIKPNAMPPAEVDFDLWLGPAATRPFNANLVHYNWHWFWDFGNGDIGNQGVHQMDIARWMIPDATLPRSVVSVGGRFGYKDQGETANTQVTLMDFGTTQLIFEVRGLKSGGYRGQTIGNILHFEEGIVANGKLYRKGSDKGEPLPQVEGNFERGKGGGIFGNFIAAVRSRKQNELDAPILEAHYSAALGHLANISYRLGKEVAFQSDTRPFGDDQAGKETMARMEEHLRKDNKIPLDGMTYRLGRKLAIDASSETIFGDADANKLLSRNYRKGFEPTV